MSKWNDLMSLAKAAIDKATPGEVVKLARSLLFLAAAIVILVFVICVLLAVPPLAERWHDGKTAPTFDGFLQVIATFLAATIGFYIVQMQIRAGQTQARQMLILEQRFQRRLELSDVIGLVNDAFDRLATAKQNINALIGAPNQVEAFSPVIELAFRRASIGNRLGETYRQHDGRVLTILGIHTTTLARELFGDASNLDWPNLLENARLKELDTTIHGIVRPNLSHLTQEDAEQQWRAWQREFRHLACELALAHIETYLALSQHIRQQIDKALPPLEAIEV